MSAPDVEALLREHGLALSDDAGRWMCRCGWTTQTVPVATDHRAHVAAIITAAYTETLAGVRAEALREAADEADCEACGHAPTDGGCPWCHSGVTVAQSGRPSSTRDGACICDYNPESTDGPQEECPFHGRPYEYWVQRAEAAEAKVARVEAVTFAFEGRADTLRSAWQVATGPSRFDAQTSEAIWREAGALTRAALADPETEAVVQARNEAMEARHVVDWDADSHEWLGTER